LKRKLQRLITVSFLQKFQPFRVKAARDVHKMRNLLEKAKKRDYEQSRPTPKPSIKRKTANRPRRLAGASADVGNGTIPAWCDNWNETCRNCSRSSSYPGLCGRSYEPPTSIERCFVEVRRRTRPMVCFVNVQSVDRIIYSIFQRFNLEWKNRTLQVFTTRSLTGTMNNIRRAANA
jgi:transposase-like protein